MSKNESGKKEPKQKSVAVTHNVVQGHFKYEADLKDLRSLLPDEVLEQLSQLVNLGPVWDVDLINKNHRDRLVSLGLAARVCYRGDTGYTSATDLGWEVLHVDDE